ncbi:MAG: hypothetical protein WEC12_06300, partial [Balneolaceae bacterium]
LSDLLYRAAQAIFLHIGIPLSRSVTPLRTSNVVFHCAKISSCSLSVPKSDRLPGLIENQNEMMPPIHSANASICLACR